MTSLLHTTHVNFQQNKGKTRLQIVQQTICTPSIRKQFTTAYKTRFVAKLLNHFVWFMKQLCIQYFNENLQISNKSEQFSFIFSSFGQEIWMMNAATAVRCYDVQKAYKRKNETDDKSENIATTDKWFQIFELVIFAMFVR